MAAPRLVCVRRCYGLDLAQIYKSKLEAAEIPVLLRYESAGPVFGITVDGLGEVRVMVPESHAEEAEALLVDLPDDELVSGEQLPDLSDGELLEGGQNPDPLS